VRWAGLRRTVEHARSTPADAPPFADPNQAIAVSALKDLTPQLLNDIGW
jgi:hypothetical protein